MQLLYCMLRFLYRFVAGTLDTGTLHRLRSDMTDAGQTPTEPTPDAIPKLSPMVILPATLRDTLRTLVMVLAIAAFSVLAASLAWRLFLVSPLPDEATELDTMGGAPLHPRQVRPDVIELEISVRKAGAVRDTLSR